jgi:hypothetical protein
LLNCEIKAVNKTSHWVPYKGSSSFANCSIAALYSWFNFFGITTFKVTK